MQIVESKSSNTITPTYSRYAGYSGIWHHKLHAGHSGHNSHAVYKSLDGMARHVKHGNNLQFMSVVKVECPSRKYNEYYESNNYLLSLVYYASWKDHLSWKSYKSLRYVEIFKLCQSKMKY